MRTGLIAAAIVLGIASSGIAGEKRAVFDRAQVSVGALASKASAVVTARAILRTEVDESTVFVVAVNSLIKGDAPAELKIIAEAGARLCEGEHLAFLDRGPDGSWLLRGGTDFGWVHLHEATRDLLLQTASAHAASDLDAMAAAASAAITGDDPRLAGDAAVDLFNSPDIAGKLGAGARKSVANLVGTAAGRGFIPGEWHYLAVAAGRLGDAESVKALICAARDSTCLPRAFAIGRAFSLVGAAGREALLDAFITEKDESALPGLMVVCAEIRLEAALPRVLSIADSGGAMARKFALVAAGDIGGSAAIGFLKAALADVRRPLLERKLAVVALAANTEPEGVKAIVEAEKEIADEDLVKFIRAFRKDPASERLQLLRTALREE